uniref:Lysine-specific metallo-endopeptidase domain-containing protein n=1 Tax=Gibberella zeae TaxID=5518 RepID=A0A4E9DF17_GIBZA
MSLSQVLVTTLCLIASQAHGIPLSPSKISSRQNPSPSSYPLKGGACGNEWKYLNFDTNKDGDRAHLELLHDVICSGELRGIASWGAFAATERQTSENVVYDLFFDTEDDTPAKVDNVLMNIAGETTEGSKAGPKVAKMIIDNSDFGKSAGNSCDNEGTLAYTQVDEDDNDREKIHFCDISYAKPIHAADIKCESLDKYPSTKMDTFSRVALHETLHYSTIGPQSKLKEEIGDQFNEDGERAYDPERAHGLNDPKQDNQPGKSENNADNYAWMSLDAIISNRCIIETTDGEKPWHSFFPDPPPKYA